MTSIFDINNRELIIFKKTSSLYEMILPEKDLDYGVLTSFNDKDLENLDRENPARYINITQKFKKNGILFDFHKKQIIASDISKIKREFKTLDLRSFTYDDYANFFLD